MEGCAIASPNMRPRRDVPQDGVRRNERIRAREVRVEVEQLICASRDMRVSGERRERVPSLSSAQRIRPSDLTPQSLTGFKLVTSTTFFPTISSGV